jgi:hypothetical protein
MGQSLQTNLGLPMTRRGSCRLASKELWFISYSLQARTPGPATSMLSFANPTPMTSEIFHFTNYPLFAKVTTPMEGAEPMRATGKDYPCSRRMTAETESTWGWRGYNNPCPARLIATLSCLFCLATSYRAASQESLRMSLSSAEAAEGRRLAAISPNYSNLKLGPTVWNFNAALEIQADDNILLESVAPKADVIFSPEFNARMVWPVSQVNSLSLAIGAGYQAYVVNPGYSRFFLTPGTELSFDLYAGDFWINFHDRASISQNTYQDPTLVGTADYSRVENALGLNATWDLNKVVIKGGYDHVNYASIEGTSTNLANQPNGQSEVFYSSAGVLVRPGRIFGLEAGGGLIHYDTTSSPQSFTDAIQWSVGPFAEAQLSEYIRGRASVGYTVFSPSAPTALPNGSEMSGLYAQLTLNHRLNQYVDYELGGGRNITFTFYGGTVDLYYARLQANWKFMRKVALSTWCNYEYGSQLTFYAETFNRVGPGISVSRWLTTQLEARVGYQFYWRSSDLPDRDYTVNLLTARLTYKF